MGRLGQKLQTFGYNFQIENQNPNLTKVRKKWSYFKGPFIIDLFLMIFDVLDAFKRKFHFLFGHQEQKKPFPRIQWPLNA